MLVVLLFVTLLSLVVLGLYSVMDNADTEETKHIEEAFTSEEPLVEVIEATVTKPRKSAFIEWDDDEPHTNHTCQYRTPIHNKINVTLNSTGDMNHQNPPTSCLFKVEENREGVDFLCSCIRQGNIEMVVMTMYELSKKGDTGELYQYLEDRFNLSKLLFDYTY